MGAYLVGVPLQGSPGALCMLFIICTLSFVCCHLYVVVCPPPGGLPVPFIHCSLFVRYHYTSFVHHCPSYIIVHHCTLLYIVHLLFVCHLFVVCTSSYVAIHHSFIVHMLSYVVHTPFIFVCCHMLFVILCPSYIVPVAMNLEI
jgi:hypothetical protein